MLIYFTLFTAIHAGCVSAKKVFPEILGCDKCFQFLSFDQHFNDPVDKLVM